MHASVTSGREDTAREAAPHGDSRPDGARAARFLVLLAVAVLFGMSIWFAGSAAAPKLTALWGLTPSQVGGISTAVQLGFVVGTAVAAVLNVADIFPAKRVFAVSAVCAALANLSLLVAPSYAWMIAGRVVSGAFLAGVYPPAMKMASTWFVTRRGIAVGTIVGALAIGKASPYLWHASPHAGVPLITWAATISAIAAALLVSFWWKDGPIEFPPRPFHWGLIREVVREARWRRATGGYLGHMFELYSYWTWIPYFFAASAVAATGDALAGDASWIGLLSFATIAVGGLGCLWGGVMGDRIGRARAASLAMMASGTCALLIGLTFGASPWVIAPLALVWGFFVIADSAQFSVLVTGAVPAHAVGTALTVQVCLGFLLSTITIQLIPPLVRWVGWSGAFVALAIGPALGVWILRPLVREEIASRNSERTEGSA